MKYLNELLIENEEWLMHRILQYAKQRDYTKYTSTLEEAWRLSITGLTDSIISSLERSEDVPELSPDMDYKNDPLTQFGIIEAKKHRQRGVPLDMFLGLMKYYKQTYFDLLLHKSKKSNNLEKHKLYIERCFDRIELAFCKEWVQTTEAEMIEELQTTNRFMVNEKNAYLTIFESLSDLIITLNKENEIVNLNFAAVSLLDKKRIPGDRYYFIEENKNIHELKEKEIIGKKATDLFPWFNEILASEDDKSKMKTHELEIVLDGQTKYYQATFSKMLDMSEKFTSAILTLRDITEIKSVENILKELNASKDKFFSIIAHDLKSPLTALIGYSQLLVDDYNILTEEEKLSFVSSISHISSGLHTLLENLLEWARIQSGKIEFTPVMFNLHESLAPSLLLLNENAKNKKIQLTEKIPAEISVYADKYMVDTIVRNLVSNAIKFTPHKGKIKLSAEPLKDRVIITVEDNGIGIPRSTLQNLFKIEKTESTMGTDKEEGTGLGLILCKEFALKNGGEISVESTVGKGSRFIVILRTNPS